MMGKGALLFLAFFAFSCIATTSVEDAPLLHDNQDGLVVPHPWRHTGSPQGHEILSIDIALKHDPKDVQALEERVLSISDPHSSEYGQWLTITQLEQALPPLSGARDIVMSWLHAHPSVRFQVLHDRVNVVGRVSALEKLFRTRLGVFTHADTRRELIRQVGASHLPAAVHAVVDLVVGLHDFRHIDAQSLASSPPLRSEDIGIIPYALLTPQLLLDMYNVPKGAETIQHAATSKGFYGPGKEMNRFDYECLDAFLECMDIHGSNITHIHGHTYAEMRHATMDELDMDAQLLCGVAQGTNSWYWTSPNDYTLGHSAAHLPEFPEVLSISFGGGESSMCGLAPEICKPLHLTDEQYVRRTNTEFMKAAARGITLVAADGDDGASGNCRTPSSIYPGSSPWLVSAGGTLITHDCEGSVERKLDPAALRKRPWPCKEQWSPYGPSKCPDLSQPFCEVSFSTRDGYVMTTGGGFSHYQQQPPYQRRAVEDWVRSSGARPAAHLFNATFRGYPDISAIGSNVAIYNQFGPAFGGGTSAAAPILAGLFTIMNDQLRQQGRPRVGFFNTALYRMREEHPAAFTDITVGTNQCTRDKTCGCPGYEATRGWDPVSGLGVPNVAEMLKYLLSLRQ